MEPRDTSSNARPSGEEHQQGSLMSRSVPGRSRAVLFAAALCSWRSAAPLSNRRFSLGRKTLILHFKEEELGSFGPTKKTTMLTSETRILWSFQGWGRWDRTCTPLRSHLSRGPPPRPWTTTSKPRFHPHPQTPPPATRAGSRSPGGPCWWSNLQQSCRPCSLHVAKQKRRKGEVAFVTQKQTRS